MIDIGNKNKQKLDGIVPIEIALWLDNNGYDGRSSHFYSVLRNGDYQLDAVGSDWEYEDLHNGRGIDKFVDAPYAFDVMNWLNRNGYYIGLKRYIECYGISLVHKYEPVNIGKLVDEAWSNPENAIIDLLKFLSETYKDLEIRKDF